MFNQALFRFKVLNKYFSFSNKFINKHLSVEMVLCSSNEMNIAKIIFT